jgi:ferric-dicitrate binding protein FerR (iron transport regulator)
MKDNNAFWLLAGKYLAGEITEPETTTLQEMLNSDPLLQDEFEEVKKIWQQTPDTEPAYAGSLLQRTHQKIAAYEAGQLEAPELHTQEQTAPAPVYTLPERQKAVSIKWMVATAAMIGLCLIGAWLLQHSNAGHPPVQWASADVPFGRQRKIILPDSSVIYVNAGSHIEYPLAFTDSIREIRLTGEAFFEVTPNTGKPFIVNSGALRTRVLGTSFNVRAYKNEEMQSVLVATGKVQVQAKDALPNILLPDQILTYHVQQQTADIAAQSYEAMNWRQNRMAFNDISFKDLSAELSRRYRKVFVFENPALEACRFRAIFNNLPADKILQQLQFTSHFNYTHKGDSIYLKGKGCE